MLRIHYTHLYIYSIADFDRKHSTAIAWINNGANQAKQSKTNQTEPNRMNENMD